MVMAMNKIMSLKNQTMSSLEIAKLTSKDHDKVMLDIERVLNDAKIGVADFRGTYKSKQGKDLKCFNLPRRECDLVISGYSVHYRLKIIDRWHELESLSQKTELEMLLLTVQKAVEHERNIKEIQHQQHETTAQLTALMEGENYFTVVGYANLIGKRVDSKIASSIGRKATKLCKAEGWNTGTANHPVFGCCNTYPKEALELIFMDEGCPIDYCGGN